jgi:hypothetical protein
MAESSKDVEQAIEVVAGNPTASELAAVVAVVSEALASQVQSNNPTPNWARGSQMLRDAKNPADLKWKSDFKGRI